MLPYASLTLLMYHSIPSPRISPSKPSGIHTFSLPGGWVLPICLCLSEKSLIAEKHANTYLFVLKKPMAADKAGVLVSFHINFCKNSTAFFKSYFDKILKSSWGYLCRCQIILVVFVD